MKTKYRSKRLMKILTILSAMLIGGWSTVSAQEETSIIQWPSEGYYTPFETQYMVPIDTLVHFRGLAPNALNSENCEWHWQLPGATPSEADTQEAAVTYTQEGIYDVGLDVSGTQQKYVQGLRAGGASFVWNIAGEERSKQEVIALGWYGYYGGTNWLNIRRYAEFFHAAGKPACIDSVAVWFGAYNVATTDAELKVSIAAIAQDGMPGDFLGSAVLPASSITRSSTAPTNFRFEQPIPVEGDFFVVIEGFPNGYGDDLAMLCVRRGLGEPCTAYHQLEDQGPDDHPMGTYYWYQNVDDPTSFAISPWLRYASTSGVETCTTAPGRKLTFNGRELFLSGAVSKLRVYHASGILVRDISHPSNSVDLSGLTRGIYLVQADETYLKIQIP